MSADEDPKERESKAADELEAEIEFREEDQVAEERSTQGDLNQGFDTGTTDSIRRGVNWPPSYRVKPSQSQASPEAQPKDSKDQKP